MGGAAHLGDLGNTVLDWWTEDSQGIERRAAENGDSHCRSRGGMSSVRRKRAAPDVAVVGTGVIGRSWIVVFARAGCQTRVFDSDPKQLRKALAWLEEDLQLDRKDGFLSVEQSAAIRRRITLHHHL